MAIQTATLAQRTLSAAPTDRVEEMDIVKKLVLSFAVLLLAACAPASPNTDAGNDAAPSDSASAAKPTCEALAERCHPYDGTNETATMCHRAVEAPTATESSCVALRSQCEAACPEGDGGHAHATDAAESHDH